MKQTRSKSNVLTQERLKELLEYKPESGEFVWLVSRGSNKAGGRAGWQHRVYGYITIQVDGQSYHSHRLVWLYNYGEFPEEQIDHIDGSRNNNKLENLREASHSENMRNSKIRSHNTSGITGVSLVEIKRENGKIYKYWRATWVNISGKSKQKLFQVSLYGDDQSKELAITFREDRIQELNDQGAGYTERHGT